MDPARIRTDRKVLIISNGHGEDSLGVLFARALSGLAPEAQAEAFPIVGLGDAYRQAGIPVVGVQKVMPSGGFVRQSPAPFLRDIRAGFLNLARTQIKALRSMADQYDWAVAMGDIVPLYLCGRYMKRPFVFFPTAKSDYIRPHYRIEILWMRRWPKVVFPRDAKTAESLRARGVNAHYVGNLMMDALAPSNRPLAGTGPLIGILPGSRRDEAYRNARLLLEAVAALEGQFRYAIALAAELEPAELIRYVGNKGWYWEEAAEPDEEGLCGYLRKGERVVAVYRRRFADILHAATAILGMAGTANEQAVGLGKPVITCPGEGPQFTAKFVAAQKRLLGEAILVTESTPDALAAGLQRVLSDRELYGRMAAEGRKRMGNPGGAEAAARYCLALPDLWIGNRMQNR